MNWPLPAKSAISATAASRKFRPIQNIGQCIKYECVVGVSSKKVHKAARFLFVLLRFVVRVNMASPLDTLPASRHLFPFMLGGDGQWMHQHFYDRKKGRI